MSVLSIKYVKLLFLFDILNKYSLFMLFLNISNKKNNANLEHTHKNV